MYVCIYYIRFSLYQSLDHMPDSLEPSLSSTATRDVCVCVHTGTYTCIQIYIISQHRCLDHMPDSLEPSLSSTAI